MTKMSDTKMTLSLDSESKRLLRNLTKAIDRLARTKYDETGGVTGVKRLKEPVEDTPKGLASGGYTGAGTKFAEPDPGRYIPGSQVELSPETLVHLQEAVSKSVILGKHNAQV